MKIGLMSTILLFTIIFEQCNTTACNLSVLDGFKVSVKTKYLGSFSVFSTGLVDGAWRENVATPTTGTQLQFFGEIVAGTKRIAEAKTPAIWSLEVNYLDPACLARRDYKLATVFPGTTVEFACQALNPFIAFSAKRILTTQAPTHLVLTGKGFSNENAMPKVSIYDSLGRLKATVTSQKLGQSNDDNSDLVIQMPSLVNFYDDDYTFAVQNVGQTGNLTIVGVGVLTIIGNGPPPDPPDPCLNERPDC
jgi:hypothetical protein